MREYAAGCCKGGRDVRETIISVIDQRTAATRPWQGLMLILRDLPAVASLCWKQDQPRFSEGDDETHFSHYSS